MLLLGFMLMACAQLPPAQKTPKDTPVETLSYVPGANLNPQSLMIYEVKDIPIPNNKFDIPITYNKEVEKWINYFTGRGREWMIKYLQNSQKLAPIFSDILEQENLPQDLIFLSMAESGFQNEIISKATAVGAWQFMPFTGRRYGLQVNHFYDERRDPHKSALAACRYLKDLHTMFNSWELAMAAYNAGEGKIGRAIKKYRTQDFWKLTKGRYLKSETKNYVPKIMALAIIGKNLDYFGFPNIEILPEEELVVKIVPPKIDLIKLAQELEMDFSYLKSLNPTYVRWHTPLEYKDYNLVIPKNKLTLFEQMASLPQAEDFQVSPYKKIKEASKHHKIPLSLLKELNQESSEEIILPLHISHSLEDKMYLDLTIKNKKPSRYSQQYSGDSYRVKKGESLWQIARKLGLSFSKIKKLNPHYKVLKPGDYISLR